MTIKPDMMEEIFDRGYDAGYATAMGRVKEALQELIKYNNGLTYGECISIIGPQYEREMMPKLHALIEELGLLDEEDEE